MKRETEKINRTLTDLGLEARTSGAGEVVHEFLDHFEGQLSDCAKILKIPGVRTLIEESCDEKTWAREEVLDYIYGRHTPVKYTSFEEISGRYSLGGQMPFSAEMVFTILLERKLLFPVKKGGQKPRYRPHEILARPSRQGAISVILTIFELQLRPGRKDLIYTGGLELTFPDGESCEIDFCLIDSPSQRLAKRKIVFGECKTRNKIKAHEARTMARVYKCLQKRGITSHVAFSNLKHGFHSNEINHFRRLVNGEGIWPILLSSKELENWFDPYRIHRKRGREVPFASPNTYEEMAQTSVSLYL